LPPYLIFCPFFSSVESFGDSVSAGNADRDDTVADKEPLIGKTINNSDEGGDYCGEI
jgi:hypothetical protein